MIMMGTDKGQQESLISPHPSIIGGRREEVDTSQVGAHSGVRVGPTVIARESDVEGREGLGGLCWWG